MRDKEIWKISLFVILCILINYIGKTEAFKLDLPIWLDSIGTSLSAYILGPTCGAIIGATGNILYGINNPLSYIYTLTGISIGITMGICMKKRLMKTLFGAFTTSMIVTIVSVLVSTPINSFFYDGYMENLWGNGVFDMLRYYGMPIFISSIIGEFCVDFLDKAITILLVYWLVKQRKFFKKLMNSKKILGYFLCLTLLISTIIFDLSICKKVYASELDKLYYGHYITTIYNNSNGLLGGTANDIVETNDGLLWIGTNDGLYQYDGKDFHYMKEFNYVKNVNCLFVDEENRLWIGTDDNGLSICVNENISNIINNESGLTSDSVHCIGEDSNGKYYVGTSKNLCILSLDGGLKIIKTIPNITYAKSISTSENGYTAVVTNDGKLFILKNLDIIFETSLSNPQEYYTCCVFDENGLLYLGTSNDYICCVDISNDKIEQTKKIDTGILKNIKSLTICDDEKNWICSENGIGYLDDNNEFYFVNTDNFNNVISNMTMDYQGNLWFTSSKLGLLKLCKSDFINIYKHLEINEVSVNAVTQCNNLLYFGTDNGLDIIDAYNNKYIENELTKYLKGKKIKHLKKDSSDHIWICTSDENEIIEIYPDGQKSIYGEMGISIKKFYCFQELKDGTMAISCDKGLIFIKNGKLIKIIEKNSKFMDSEIITIFEKNDGTILAGTNGNGIIVIKDDKIVDEIKKKDGLGSDIILKMVSDNNGIFIITGSSVCYMDNFYKVKSFDKFPYYDNYDILNVGDDTLWILGGAGIYIANKNSLLLNKTSSYQLIGSNTGLESPLTENAQNYIDENGNLYLPCNSGCYYVNINEYNKKEESYRIKVKYINVDDTKYYVSRSEITNIDRNSKIIEIVPVLINYSLNNPYIRYYLEGFDTEPIIVNQSDLKDIIYTNLHSGNYTFHLDILDNQKSKVIASASYEIYKEIGIFENWWFKTYFILICILVVVWLSWFLTRLHTNKTLEEEKHKLAIARKQTEMGNETIIAIAKTVDAKDGNTSQHSERVSEYSVMLAKKLGWNNERCENLRKTALLHDIGKIGIPDSILNKPSKLTDEEYALMKSHVEIGAEILKDFTIVESVSDGARYHHERYDGKGYIKGLKGEDIPINARIIGIADAFDAMTSNRVYRKHLDMDYVIAELEKGSGTQFDPELVKLMIELIIDGSINVNNK